MGNLAEEVEALIEKHLKREIQEYKLLVDKIISSSNDKERGITVKELLKLTAVMKCTIEEICSGFKCFLDIQDNDELDQIKEMSGNRISYVKELKRKYHDMAMGSNAMYYDGIYTAAKEVYKLSNMRLEGDQSHPGPLGDAEVLKRYFDLQLPSGPWLEHYGRLIGSHPLLDLNDKVAVTKHLLQGCESQKSQLGYFRALRGFSE